MNPKPPQLISLRQPFPDRAREIWVLVCSAGAFVDQTALLQLSERQPTGGDGVVLVKHFVGRAVNEHSPIPWCALVDCSLRADGRRAVARNSIVPARMLV